MQAIRMRDIRMHATRMQATCMQITRTQAEVEVNQGNFGVERFAAILDIMGAAPWQMGVTVTKGLEDEHEEQRPSLPVRAAYG